MSNNKKDKPKISNAISGSLKDNEKRRRQVFKPVLDNPYTQTKLWSYVAPDLSNTILEHLNLILSNLGNYNKLIIEAKETNNDKQIPPVPEIRNKITIGFNSTVKALEIQASKNKAIIVLKTNPRKKYKSSDDHPYIKYVFVTRYDIVPNLLTNPFPVLSYTSSKSAHDRVKLIQLPKGSMSRLSSILNIDNTGILGLSSDILEAEALFNIIESEVKDIDVPWLSGLFSDSNQYSLCQFRKPAMKILSTSAPLVPKRNDQKAKKNN